MELQDFQRGFLLIGDYDGTPVVLAVTEDGILYILATGTDADSNLLPLRTDADGQLIMVPRGQSGNYLDIDTDGFMTAVIKGDYEGDLKTVATDGSGRLSAFVIDNVDAWGRLLSIGNAELAARLKSSDRYDRRGNVLHIEDFESGLGGVRLSYTVRPTNTVLEPEFSNSLGYCAKCSVDATPGDVEQLYIAKTWIVNGRIGLECAFSMPSDDISIKLFLQRYDGVECIWGGVKYDPDAETLGYATGTNTFTNFATGLSIYTTYVNWHHFKFVMDIDTEKYVRCLYRNTEYDLSAYSLYSFASSVDPHLVARVEIEQESGTAGHVFIDDIILTTAEPE